MKRNPRSGPVRRFLAELGPGLITGAADDDPSGISTYSVVGAAFGYTTLWTAMLSFPLLTAVELMCARLGMVTGRGLAGVVRRRYPAWVLWGACSLLVTANIINIGADLGGMAEVSEMVTGIPSLVWTPLYAAAIVSLLLWSSYRHIAAVFKWLTLVLFAYVVTAFLSQPAWWAVLRATFIPQMRWSSEYLTAVVGILGTTITPYLFFWQAAEQVEEERAAGRRSVQQRRGATGEELRRARTDVMAGMLLSTLIMYFITLTTGATLHAQGQTRIETARQAAEALRPLAGAGAYWLFTLGIIGTGMLAVPVLATSCAYAIAEAAAWRASLEYRPHLSRKFYSVIGLSMLLGLALDYAGFNAVAMLFASAVVNGLLAPPLILLVVLLTSDRRVMGDHINSPWLRWLGWATFVLMSVASIAMLAARWIG